MDAARIRDADWLSFPEALERVLAAAPPLPVEAVSLIDAEGRAAAGEVRSPLTLPPGPTSHMDGFALASADLLALRDGAGDDGRDGFQVVGASFPGSPWTEALPSGTAARIMTGALLPPGADTIVPVEEAEFDSDSGVVRIRLDTLPVSPASLAGRHVRPAGEESREGELLARPGETLDFRLLALLAAAGTETVQAYPVPRVALLVTGSELVPPGSLAALKRGIHRADILSTSLASLVRWGSGQITTVRRVGDDPAALRDAILSAARDADILITTGGASMGEADFVKGALLEAGGEIDFWRIRMRPGSPVSLGRLPRSDGRPPLPVLGLPGNPVSAMVGLVLLGLPAIRSLGGHARQTLRTIRATVRAPLPGPAHLTRFPRVRLLAEGGGSWGATPEGEDGSGVIRGIARADGIALIAEGKPAPLAGEEIEVLLLPGAEWVEGAG